MKLVHQMIAEMVGTFLLTLFIIGAVAAAVLTGSQVGLWQVAAVIGFGVSLAIYATAAVSGAHLNPAVSLAMALFRGGDFPARRIPAYWGAQLAGAAVAGLVLLAVFGPFLERFESENGIDRGAEGSERSAMVFGEYFPNPASAGVDEAARSLISPARAAAVEALGTGILVFMIFALTDRRNGRIARGSMWPFFIGFTVAVLISLLAPLTQGGFNPARDFGPRLVAFFAGWGAQAIPGPSAGFWVYIVGPLVGGPVGAAIYQWGIRPRGSRDDEG